MPHVTSEGHVLSIEGEKFRLTYVSKSSGGATFSSELGDFCEFEIQEWFKDHLHPGTDFNSLFHTLTKEPELSVPVGQTMMLCNYDEDGQLVKAPASVEQVCDWLADYQRLYFGDKPITIVVDLIENKKLKATAGFCPSYSRMGSMFFSAELVEFSNALKISVLHELIHANLFAANGDADDNHGDRFQSEVKRLMGLGAYNSLV